MSLLTVKNLGKAYRVYASEFQRIGRWFGISTKPKEEHWVLKHVNFSIHAGEAIGIVGQNGAGKSTLLKMITGTLQPTEGNVQVNGRIAAILELGMGFTPDLTGRQNVYHAAGLMGFNADRIDEVIKEIEAFAEIGTYFDEPVRTYSSGMQMRVAFAVATAIRPEILIVDEALSVGDSYFQHKSFDRIREFQQQGTTLLIVSHDRGSIQALCNRAILLEKGTVIKDGKPEEVMDFYNALIAEKENSTVQTRELEEGGVQTRSGSGEATIGLVTLHNAAGERIEYVSVGETVSLRINAQVNSAIPELVVGYLIKDRLGQPVYGTNTHHMGCKVSDLQAGESLDYSFSFTANLGPGSYSVAVALHTTDSHLSRNYEWVDLTLVFNVVNISQSEFVGMAWLPPVVECSR
ncbi:ABC transporter ATP-binding protein [Pseudomonas amygdali pv. morsprunorum]|uniref:Lipopolysaccharide ABC export system, ATP-binding protein n=3 Tax=Pseudomonas syringae group genomosp. 2 TaxID=251698 RepID=A0A0P9UBD7_PSEA0|nr:MULTISPECIES: ABC transporter ATP-binding protein [Pseudomonas syringae group]PPS30734.1 ABC transporter ATP-binding protein [Pseudomonas amygdali pv. morsprunorum]KPB63222.1 Lipopolysaccharide ABC export system [Pseudomonas amygdali pv. myricae]KPX22862.1 Lipopolysaccharide ABC export system, ATP-binding protein [Pseudomonas amygdali pv. eriobotryae]KPX53566.1 Lipopolysaccharide ABC export system, ATP-binding protein [Pseudomonas amygdali pv. photiniae]KPY00705.1 Lipopolysaccharide ABC exp